MAFHITDIFRLLHIRRLKLQSFDLFDCFKRLLARRPCLCAPSLQREPLAVCMESPFEKLDPMYRINFGITYTVEHNMEIRDVGYIADSSMETFHRYVAEALNAN